MLYPLKFKPLLKERLWGGSGLARLGKKLPAAGRIGESWEISGLAGDVSVVSNGALKGNTLEEMVEIFMGELVGDRIYNKFGVEFPLLIKLIDARDLLSIQVHPGDEMARERHHSYGKTEMWYVIDSEPGASLYLGFSRSVSSEEYSQAQREERLAELLNREDARPGDAFFVPAGTIHAIGKGIVLAEIQQTSDVTYRVDDWGRTDQEGNPRELHTELALGAIDFSGTRGFKKRPVPEKNISVPLVESGYFTTNLLECEGEVEKDYSWLDCFVVYMCVEGEADVCWSGGREKISTGETILIPAIEDNITLSGKAKLLEIYID